VGAGLPRAHFSVAAAPAVNRLLRAQAVLRHLRTTGQAAAPEPAADAAATYPDATADPGHAEDSLPSVSPAGAYW
jgi:hypothetical protein